jgi:Flp pilus assembly protein CpaB
MNRSTVMHKRSNMLLLVGALAFAIGAALVVSVLRDDGGSSKGAAAGEVLVATRAIPAGTAGDDIISGKLVELRSVPGDLRAGDALTDSSQLAGRIIDADVAAGEQVRVASLRPQTLRANAISIPDGKQGVAVQLPFVAGGAGYVGPGDNVNIYANLTPKDGASAITKLVLGNVKVLDVSTEVAPRVASGGERPAGSNVTYLLALDPNEAEQVIFLAANAQIWLALQDADAPAPGATSGRTLTDVLR